MLADTTVGKVLRTIPMTEAIEGAGNSVLDAADCPRSIRCLQQTIAVRRLISTDPTIICGHQPDELFNPGPTEPDGH